MDIQIPSTAGYVIETHQPTTTQQSPPIIVHIQEAHTNPEAQQNIIHILEQLVEQHGLSLILVEGGQGDVGLSYLRQYGPPAHRLEVAQKYLKAGLISAEEYLDIASDHHFVLWGVEDRALYDQNVEAFLGAEALREQLAPAIEALQRVAEQLRPRLLSQELNALDAQEQAYHNNTLTLADYAGTLEQTASHAGLSLAGHPNLERFLRVRRLEQAIERSQVQQEQRRLIAELSSRVPPQEMDTLLTMASGMQAGTVPLTDFYGTLSRLAHTASVTFDAYPKLSEYMAYVTQSADVSTPSLTRELDAVIRDLRHRLAVTPEGQQLCDTLQTLTLLRKMVQFDLSPGEYRQLHERQLEQDGAWSGWKGFLSDQLRQAGLPSESAQELRKIQEAWPQLQRFYALADQRDGALVANAMQKLQESGERLAVLITGGYHSPRITAMLHERGIATLVLVPKVSHATDDRLYRAVVKYKSGRGGSVEEVMAIARESEATR